MPGTLPPDASLKPLTPHDRSSLELELIQLRAEAKAQRLEARAAQIELLLKQAGFGTSTIKHREPATAVDFPADQPPLDDLAAAVSSVAWKEAKPNTTPPNFAPASAFNSWHDILAATIDRLPPATTLNRTVQSSATTAKPKCESVTPQRVAPEPVASEPVASEPVTPQQVASESVTPQRVASSTPRQLVQPATPSPVVAETPDDNASPRRGKAGWLFSLVVHAAVLPMLALITLSIKEPGDQIALSAAHVDPHEERVEAIEIESTVAPEASQPAEQIPTIEPVTDPLADIGELVADLTTPTLDTLSATPMPTTADSLSSNLNSSITTSADVTTSFFGVAGGGNHFVYLVDNSGSMDDIAKHGFDEARDEVLRAVDQLREDQRFYVIFFGEQTLCMRLSDVTQDEPKSVYATPANKAALRRWAGTIQMQTGKWPEQALQVAFKLRPDCIFLLTDGAMSQRVVPLIREHNIVDTIIDGSKPRSLIHTVGFHNQSGEEQLQLIARENGGQYRFVPATRNGR